MKLQAKKRYIAEIEVEAESKEAVSQLLATLCLKPYDIRLANDKRSPAQNRSLHKLIKMLSDECMDKGITLNQIVKDGYQIEATPENLKMLWKKLQESLFGTKSTTELKISGEIDIVYRNFNAILIERTKGEISLPPWPSEEEKLSTR